MPLQSLLDATTTIPDDEVLRRVGAEHRASTRPDRPWLFTNMVSSIDGAAAVDGLSGELGDADDRTMFRALRAAADAILVGSTTVNAERYRPPMVPPEIAEIRRDNGRTERPTMVVVSASLSIDLDVELFQSPTDRPIVMTASSADPDRRAAVAQCAEVIEMGDEIVDFDAALRHLASSGHRTVLSEGGPSINGQLVRDGLVDEWNMTVAPVLVGGAAPRPARSTEDGPSADDLVSYRIERLWQGERALFGRWVRS